MAIVRIEGRPAVTIRDGQMPDDLPANWRSSLEEAKANIEHAIGGTARLETSDGTLPYLGTAFVVASRLAITTKHVAAFLYSRGNAPASYWLNFKAEQGSDEKFNVPIGQVILMHPHLDYAVLQLEDDVAPERILRFSDAPLKPGKDICVIGYPSFDVRNDQEVQAQVFQSVYGIKRLMPGRVLKYDLQSSDKPFASLVHDATTLGGTAGAPVIDLETGHVAGIGFAGAYMLANYAVPTEGLSGLLDLLGTGVSSADRGGPRSVLGGRIRSSLRNIFTFDDISRLHGILVSDFSRDSEMQSLFYGLPAELFASLPNGDTNSDKLLVRLQYLNRFGALIDFENHTPLYLLLNTARTLRISNPETVATFDKYIARVVQAETKAKDDAQNK